MSAYDPAALRAAAEAATPGPWHVCSEPPHDADSAVVNANHDPVAVQLDEWYESDPDEPTAVHDAAYIAAANPATVLALLDDLAAKDARIAELEAEQRGPGWFWTRAEWAEWSNDLARLVPEEYHDDVAQEAIIERALGDLAARVEAAESALAECREREARLREALEIIASATTIADAVPDVRKFARAILDGGEGQ